MRTTTNSALDPAVDGVAWRAWELRSALPCGDPGGRERALLGFRFLTEQLCVPGRTCIVVQAAFDPNRSRPGVRVHLAVGAFGSRIGLDAEARTIGEIVTAELVRPSSPIDALPVGIEEVFGMVCDLGHSALIRQRVVDVDDGADGDVAVLSRWRTPVDPWDDVIRVLSHQSHNVAVRVTAVPTSASVDDRASVRAALQATASICADPRAPVDAMVPADRALSTLIDLTNTLSTPLLCGELAVIGAEPLSDRLVRSIASCFTSEFDLERRPNGVVLAPTAALRGGFDVEHQPARHLEAVRAGIPLRGGLCERDLRDLWTMSESPLGWPVGSSAVSEALRTSPAAPAAIDALAASCRSI